jgi:hypothetical protein
MSQPTVAIIGASADRGKFGNKSVRAHHQCGWKVVPIHPSAAEIEGLTCFPSLDAFPDAVDRVSVYVPPAIGITLLEKIKAKHPKEIWFNPGSESFDLLERARALELEPILGCSILELGVSPDDFP